MPTPDQALTTSGDGIADLQARRRQRRVPLPPRHPRPAEAEPGVSDTAADATAIDVRDDQTEARVEVAEHDPLPSPKVVLTGRRAPRPKVSQQAEMVVPLRLAQFYVTPDHDDALRRIRATGLVEGMDVSGSAVIRYALDELLAKHKPEELARLLGSPKGQKQGRRGRPRR